ncbi:hypothetical protein Pcinc_000421 [Petrolisthes cinctipes]|uniref:Uncharacterized protein n=1 Tax=Petrolisthes cinctipes TaxID=88211 RepID=A0AAE1GAE6_PETCI|nr:hypothetical protein Pcinc_006574 [Petrolisthes cinctipes]KAK3895803.1 hypothetical protein Pcinc_000421 [Petrolisthes cinctipes]
MVGHLHCSPHAPCFTPKGYDPLARGVCRPGAELCRETPASARTQNSPALASFRNTGTRAWRMAGPDSLLALHCVLFLPDLRGGSSGGLSPPPESSLPARLSYRVQGLSVGSPYPSHSLFICKP